MNPLGELNDDPAGREERNRHRAHLQFEGIIPHPNNANLVADYGIPSTVISSQYTGDSVPCVSWYCTSNWIPTKLSGGVNV